MIKQDEINLAKKRRASLLKEFNKFEYSISQFALLHGMTRQRMWILLKKAKHEAIK